MDTEEFKTFLAPLYRRMYAVSLAIIGDADEAADAVQDSAMRLFEMRGRLGAGGQVGRPESFAIFVVRNYSIDRLRQLSRHRCVAIDADKAMTDVAAPDSEIAADAAADLKRVRSLMGELAPRQREVLELTAVGGMDVHEVADELKLTENNVRQLLSRARRRMRELFYNC